MSQSTQNYYNHNAQSFAESTFSLDMSALYDEFLPLIPAGGAILDAGCGSGRDALFFKQSGFRVTAFDASEKLAVIAAQNLQQTVPVKTFTQVAELNEYDGIWCCASLLHVSKKDLPTVFSKLKNALKPDGVLYVSFKYGDTEREKDGRVFTDLNEQGLAELIELAGLTIIKSWQTGDQRADRAAEIWLNALLQQRVTIK